MNINDNTNALQSLLEISNNLLGSGTSNIFETIPNYHYIEAARVLENIENFKTQHPNYLIFGAVSDNHVYVNDATYEAQTKASIRHAAFALETVGAMSECDFIINLGDNCWENGIDTSNAFEGATYTVNTLKPAFNRIPAFAIAGNHDKSDNTEKLHNLVSAGNPYTVSANTAIRGFGYTDFDNKKIRAIFLNSVDYLNASGGYGMSYEQKDFLMKALDLSSKTNAAEWQIIIFSHVPVDFNGGDYNVYTDLNNILSAYVNGEQAIVEVIDNYCINETPSTYSTFTTSIGTYDDNAIGALTYSYIGKNSSKIIANIHGHVHTNAFGNMDVTGILRMATPNTCFYLNKTDSYSSNGNYSITSTEASKLVKTANTAKDTAVTFYCIDLDKKIIESYAYGAGTDRVAYYTDEDIYSVTYNLTNVYSTNNIPSVIHNSSYNTTLSMSDDAISMSSIKVTMGGVDITSTVLNDKVINISKVTGDIVITAIAKVEEFTEVVTNKAAAARMYPYWHEDMGTDVSFNNENFNAIIGVSVENECAVATRESSTIYLIPVPPKATKVIIESTDTNIANYTYLGVNYNNGAYTKVFYDVFVPNNTREFEKGSIEYLAVSVGYDSTIGTKIDWGYDTSKVTITFTNVADATGGGSTGNETEEPTTGYTNLFSSTDANFVNGYRFSSSGGNTSGADAFLSGYISAVQGDTIYVKCPNGDYSTGTGNNLRCICTYNSSKTNISCKYPTDVTVNGDSFQYTITDANCAFVRVSGHPQGNYSGFIVTKNEPIV